MKHLTFTDISSHQYDENLSLLYWNFSHKANEAIYVKLQVKITSYRLHGIHVKGN
jgi:hypothetical protein